MRAVAPVDLERFNRYAAEARLPEATIHAMSSQIGRLGDVPSPSDISGWHGWTRSAFGELPDRWSHTQAIWRQASAISAASSSLSNHECTTLELAALLHDIGRVIDRADAVPHALVSAWFASAALLDEAATVIAHHSGAHEEARMRNCDALFASWPRPRGSLLPILTYLDSTTSPTGDAVSVDERLMSIRDRYGPESVQARAFEMISDEIAHGRLAAGAAC